MIKNKTELLNAVDQMTFFESDANVINSLLELVSPKLFTKILEEIIDGNMYWSDFLVLFSNTSYPFILKENFKNEKEILNYINRFRKLQTSVLNSFDYKNNGIALSFGDIEEKEKERYIDNTLIEMLKPDKDDTFVQTAVKKKLYSSIRNYDNQIEGEEKLDKNDILFFANTYYAPILQKFQKLDSYDREFMRKNNLSEDMVKEMKSLAIILEMKEDS